MTATSEGAPRRPRLIERMARRQVERKTGHDPQSVSGARRAITRIQPAVPENFLKDILDRADSTPEHQRSGYIGNVHVSTLTNGVCPRAFVLAGLYVNQGLENVTGGHRIVWAFGRAVEAHIRAQLLANEEFQQFRVYGRWECTCGHTKHVGTRPEGLICPKCGGHADIYKEEPFIDEEYAIQGNPDVSLLLNGFYMPVEIKSMTNSPNAKGVKPWSSLREPLPEHLNQCLFYRWLAQRNGFRVLDKITFIYTCKEFLWGSPYKQFIVDATTSRCTEIINRSLELARQIKLGFDTRTPPPRLPACATPDSKACKRCNMCVPCWSVD